MRTSLLTLSLALTAMAPAAAADSGAAASAAEVRPILVGAEIPDATLRNPAGESVSLRAVAAKAPTALIFYRGGW